MPSWLNARLTPNPIKASRHLLRRILTAGQLAFSPYARGYPPGHFYSPLPDVKEVKGNSAQLFRRDVAECPGIDLRAEEQLAMLERLGSFYDELNFPETRDPRFRFYYLNAYFSHGEAAVLFGMLRHFRPRRIIEIGAGFSSAAMLDINDAFLGGGVEFTFIDPLPARLTGVLRADDLVEHEVIAEPIQRVDLAIYDSLGAGDVLFVDSSHVGKIGSDVLHIFFHVLPRLRPGVVVHFHDIYWPFEYLEEWVVKGRAWNEAYMLRAFLQYNSQFQIIYFNDFMSSIHPEQVGQHLPVCLSHAGSSIWLRKV